jgi:DNA-binding MarR family transcriptional regulator
MSLYINAKFMNHEKLQSLPRADLYKLIEIWQMQAYAGHTIKSKLPRSPEIAAELGVSIQEADAMIEVLSKHGFIKSRK